MTIRRDTPVSPEDVHATAACASKSERMRVLSRKGYATARIAEALGVRYQFVRNVLAHDARSADRPPAAGMAEQTPPVFEHQAGDGVLRLTVEDGGVIRLPQEALDRLGFRTGSIVITLVEDDRLVLLSTPAAVRRVQDMVKAMNIAPDRLLSEELIQERRAEAAAEDRGG